MVKVNTSVSMSLEMKKHIDNNPEIESFSSWARKAYAKEFMQTEKIAKKLDKKLREIEHLKEDLKRSKAELKILSKTISREALLWLQAEGKKRARKYSEEGVFKYFINKYELHDKINRRQFKILLEGNL